MKDIELTREIIVAAKITDSGYFDYAAIVARRLPKQLYEQLEQLINGPVWEGNIISKPLRNELFSLGLAIRICSNGEQGYTGATYFAYTVMKIANEIKIGKRG